MLIAQDFIWFASYADRTRLNLGFASDADRTRLHFDFALDVDCTGLLFGSPRMLIAQELLFTCLQTRLNLPLTASLVALWLCHACLLDWTYTSDASLVRIQNSLKGLICLNYFLSPRRFFWSFYWVQDPFSPCIPISDKKTYIWYNVWMLCMVVHEWNVCALDSLLWSFLLLSLPPSCPCTLYRPIGAISFSFVLEDISVLMLSHRIVSHFSFLERKTILVQAFTH